MGRAVTFHRGFAASGEPRGWWTVVGYFLNDATSADGLLPRAGPSFLYLLNHFVDDTFLPYLDAAHVRSPGKHAYDPTPTRHLRALCAHTRTAARFSPPPRMRAYRAAPRTLRARD